MSLVRSFRPARIQTWGRPCLLSICLLAPFLPGCGSSSTKTVTPPPTPVSSANRYVALNTESFFDANSLAANGYTLTLDHSANVLTQDDISSGSPTPISSGSFTSTNGFLNATLNPFNGSVVASAETGNWLLEEQGVMGFAYLSSPDSQGLDGNVSGNAGQGDTSRNLIPFASNASCTDVAKQQTYQYLTFPGSSFPQSWDYQTDPAYGTLQIATLQSGQVVNLTAIQQFLLPGASVPPGTAATLDPGPVSISGACGTSAAGSLISVTYVDISGLSHYAEISLAGGFLLENNKGLGIENFGISNILGSGFGAVGLVQPASAVDVSALTGGTYQGFIRVPDTYTSTAGFGTGTGGSGSCSALKTSLQTLATQPSANTIYGGEYSGNDPSTNKTSNCDLAIDLGTQDSTHSGLFTGATIFVGASFPLNNPVLTGAPGVPYSFPGIAIAGQIDGKNAVFVLAQDTVASQGHPIAFYLLQSNQ